MRILFFGDSITHGDGQGGWVQVLRSSYEKLPDENGDTHEVYNLGISGNVAANVVKRLALETEARRWYDEQLLIVVAIGMNDTKFKEEDVASTPDLYKGELEQIVSAARQYSEKILFVGLTPVDDKLCNPFKDSIAGSCYTNKRILEFEKVLQDFCSEATIPFVELYKPFVEGHSKESMLADGLHPNGKGHQLIAELVRPELDNLL